MTALTRNATLTYLFGPFRLDPVEQILYRESVPVPLTGKAFQTLAFLVEHAGRALTKDELLNEIWPDTFIEEITLAQNISTIRKALEDNGPERKYIETLPRRGYRFVAPVSLEDDAPAATAEALTVLPRRAAWVPGAVILLILIAAAIAAYFLLKGRDKPVAQKLEVRSVAVLPFKPLANDSRDEALELGMADALITKLSNIQQVVVRPTSSILKYNQIDQDMLAIGREQNVDSVLQGKIQHAGDQVRVTVQLVRSADGSPLWAGQFDERFTNIFAVQDSISRQVAQALVRKLTGREEAGLSKRYTDNVEAYTVYAKGRYFWNQFSEDGFSKAIAYYKQAIQSDPDYALAYTGLSTAYTAQGAFGVRRPVEAAPDARQMAERAVQIDDSLAEAHVALGGVRLFVDWNRPAAESELRRAIELNDNNSEAHELMGYYDQSMGDLDAALNEFKRARELAPISPVISDDLAYAYYYKGDYESALISFRNTSEIDPKFLGSLYLPAQIYERTGDYDRAIAASKQAIGIFGRAPAILPVMGRAYALSGDRNEAKRIASELEAAWEQHYFSPVGIALLHSALGDNDRAFHWLSKAYEERDSQLMWLKVEPQYEQLRKDARFNALLQKVGFPPDN